MVPAAVVLLPELPLTRNGKVDRAALPAPDVTAGGAGGAARTDAERVLAGIFAELLLGAGPAAGDPDAAAPPEHPPVGVADSFFDLGGDSVAAIQLVARARGHGLVLQLKDVFAAPTVAGLAALARRESDVTAREDPAAGWGTLPAPPLLRRFAELAHPAGAAGLAGFNQAVLLRTPPDLDPAALGAALRAVIDRHDALRLSARPPEAGSGPWRVAVVPPAGPAAAGPVVHRVDVTATADLRPVLGEHARRARGLLRPETGGLAQVVWFDAGAAPGRLLIMVHHFAVDAVSWPILLADLAAAYRAAREGTEPRLAPVATSYRRWAQQLVVAAADPARLAELEHWTATLSGAPDPLPAPPVAPVAPPAGRSPAAAAAHLRQRLDAAYTERLLRDVAQEFHAGPLDLLLTALARAVRKWSGAPDAPVVVDVESHGRHELAAGMDLSRTVGWFARSTPSGSTRAPTRPLARR